MQTFLVLWVLLHSVEKMPSVQSFVATSRRPNIWGAVMAFGFILISLCGAPHSVMAFMRTLMHLVLPAPDGPNVIIPWRTRWVSNSWIHFKIHAGQWIRFNSCTCNTLTHGNKISLLPCCSISLTQECVWLKNQNKHYLWPSFTNCMSFQSLPDAQ